MLSAPVRKEVGNPAVSPRAKYDNPEEQRAEKCACLVQNPIVLRQLAGSLRSD